MSNQNLIDNLIDPAQGDEHIVFMTCYQPVYLIFLQQKTDKFGNHLTSVKNKIVTFLLLKQWKDVLAITAFRALKKILLEALLLLHMDFYRQKELGLLWLETKR